MISLGQCATLRTGISRTFGKRVNVALMASSALSGVVFIVLSCGLVKQTEAVIGEWMDMCALKNLRVLCIQHPPPDEKPLGISIIIRKNLFIEIPMINGGGGLNAGSAKFFKWRKSPLMVGCRFSRLTKVTALTRLKRRGVGKHSCRRFVSG